MSEDDFYCDFLSALAFALLDASGLVPRLNEDVPLVWSGCMFGEEREFQVRVWIIADSRAFTDYYIDVIVMDDGDPVVVARVQRGFDRKGEAVKSLYRQLRDYMKEGKGHV